MSSSTSSNNLKLEDGALVVVLVCVKERSRLHQFDGVDHNGGAGTPRAGDHVTSGLPTVPVYPR